MKIISNKEYKQLFKKLIELGYLVEEVEKLKRYNSILNLLFYGLFGLVLLSILAVILLT